MKTDFFLWVRIMLASERNDYKLLSRAITDIFDGKIPKCTHDELLSGISEYISMIQSERGQAERSGATSNVGSRAFDLEADGNVIYCELWQHFPALMQKGISFAEGMELINLLISNETTVIHHRAFARCGDFSQMSKEERSFWNREKAKYALKMTDDEIDEVFSESFA